MISSFDHAAAGPEIDIVSQVKNIFSPDGILSRSPNFEYRPQQQEMAISVAQSLVAQNHLIVEAGTGVGKSLAYLIPSILYALEYKKKAVVSTNTINLQEQLVEKDLPMLKQILPPFKFSMLKGRQNYLCTRRLSKAMKQADSLFTTPEAQELQRLYEWSKSTNDGSLSDFEVEPDFKVWQQVCSERGLCSPKKCGSQSEFAESNNPCFFQRARSRILSSDVLVLNHTLFFMHLGMADEEDKTGVLFKNDFVIFDEAHCVESVASRHIGLSVSSGQIRYALQRLWNPRTEKGLLSLLRRGAEVKKIHELLHLSDEFFSDVEISCDQIYENEKSGKPWVRDREWRELRIRKPDLVPDSLTLPIQRLRDSISSLIQTADDKDTADELLDCNRRLLELREALSIFLSQSEEDHVYWVERSGKRLTQITLNAAPIDISKLLRRRLFGTDTSVVMTSATLSVRDSTRKLQEKSSSRHPAHRTSKKSGSGLEYITHRIGGESAQVLQVGSPFDYTQQMKLYGVGKMPDPREKGYEESLIHWIEHFVQKTQGKAFVLFTNIRLMHKVADQMEPFFHQQGIECLVHGTGIPRSLMLEKFKENTQSVLFGADSFWQGVDVPGESLSNVIITRLPFAVPDHPLIQARVEKIEAEGGNSFMDFSLPEAILKFRQGVGRLIRTKKDSGIIVILDNRVLTKRYGQSFLDALPETELEIV